MGGGGGGLDSGEPEFQIAPILDVLLTLLIFFVSITSAQVEQLDTRVKVPVAPNSKERKPDPNQVMINVRWEDPKAIFSYQSVDYTGEDGKEQLAEQLKTRAANNPKFEVIIRADRTTPAKEVQNAMQVAAQATAKVSFSTVDRE